MGISLSLPQGGFWCVDGSGISRGKNAAGVAYTAIGTAVATATFVSGGTTCN